MNHAYLLILFPALILALLPGLPASALTPMQDAGQSVPAAYVSEALSVVGSTYMEHTWIAGSPTYTLYQLAVEKQATDPDEALRLLNASITMDTDGDGLPDQMELYDGLSPYAERSFGAPDPYVMVERGIVVDGYPEDWGYAEHASIPVTPSTTGSALPGDEPAVLYVARDVGRVYIAVVFRDPPAINTSYTRYTLGVSGGDGVEVVEKASLLCIEASLTVHSSVFTVTLYINGEEAFTANITVAELPLYRINPDYPRSHVYPAWKWFYPIPGNQPWYPLVVFGDNRPSDWVNGVRYSDEYYRLIDEVKTLYPEAVIGTGDHVGAGKREQIDEFLATLVGTRNPWIVAGNHDWSYTHLGADRGYWERMVNSNLAVYDYIPGWRIILINGYAIDHGLSRGDVEEAVETAGNRHVILVFHVPPITSNYDYPTDFARTAMDFLRGIIKNSPSVKIVLCGHWHVWRREKYGNADLIITGGGGAPLSSATLGLPINHYVSLVLRPDGSYTVTPIALDGGTVTVTWIRYTPSSWGVVVSNSKKNVYGAPVAVPVSLPIALLGVRVEVNAVVPPGTHRFNVSISEAGVTVAAEQGIEYYVTVGNETVEGEGTETTVNVAWSPEAVQEIRLLIGSIRLVVEAEGSPTYILRSHTGEVIDSGPLSWNTSSYYSDIRLAGDTIVNSTVYIVGYRELAVIGPETFYADISPPQITVRGLPGYTRGDVTVEVTVWDTGLRWVAAFLDNSMLFNDTCSPPNYTRELVLPFSAKPEGSYVFRVEAMDGHGHLSVDEQRVVVDRTPPAVSIEAPAEVNESDVFTETLSVAVVDANPDYVEVYVNGTRKAVEPVGGEAIEIPLHRLGIVLPGTYLVTVKAYDKAGNTGTENTTIHVYSAVPGGTQPGNNTVQPGNTAGNETTGPAPSGSGGGWLNTVLIIAVIVIIAVAGLYLFRYR